MPLRCNVVALLGYIQMDKEGLGLRVKRSHFGHGPEVPDKILFQAFCTWLENNPSNLQRQLIFHASKGQRSQVHPLTSTFWPLKNNRISPSPSSPQIMLRDNMFLDINQGKHGWCTRVLLLTTVKPSQLCTIDIACELSCRSLSLVGIEGFSPGTSPSVQTMNKGQPRATRLLVSIILSVLPS